MANYSFAGSRTTPTTASTINLNAPATAMKRVKWYELIIGSEGVPADVANAWQIFRSTTAGTATAVTPNALDPADPACVAVASYNSTVTPTTSGFSALDISLNQKASFRWVAAPGGELVIPATANAGLTLLANSGGTTVSCTATCMFQEQ